MGYDTHGDNATPIVMALFGFLISFILVMVLIASHDHSSNAPAKLVLPDSKSSVVTLSNGVSKFCDGTTMVYKTDNAITTQPNSDKCQ